MIELKAEIERNIEIYRAVKSGQKTQNQVAKEIGVSRQRINQVIKIVENAAKSGGTSWKASASRVIYPAIGKWMREKNLTMGQFSEICIHCSSHCLRNFLFGESKGSIDLIKSILKVTGMTFEEAFSTEE